MRSVLKSLLVFSFIAFTFSEVRAEDEEGFVPLFDGKSLAGWTAARSSGEGDWGAFTVNEQEQAIHAYAGAEEGSKQDSDCLNTVQQFSHYILRLEYKWVGNRFKPRADWDRDAGLLYHVHGDLKRVWPHSLEMQIGETPGNSKNNLRRRFHTGDLFVLGRHLLTKTPREGRFYKAGVEPVGGRHVQTKLGVEKPMGEWNKMEIQIHGAEKAIFVFNGEVVHEVYDMQQKQKDSDLVPLDKGHIGLQAEWAEIMYRKIRIKELSVEGS